MPENDFVVLPLAYVIVIDTEAPPTGLFVLASVTVTMTVCVLPRVIVSLANDIERASCLLPPPEPPFSTDFNHIFYDSCSMTGSTAIVLIHKL